MDTPRRSNSNSALNTGPSRTLLQQLLEEINGAPAAQTAHTACPSVSSASTYSRASSQDPSPSIWVRGSSLAQDVRDKLRAADEAHRQKLAAIAVDGAPDCKTSTLYLDMPRLDIMDTAPRDEFGRGCFAFQQTPDPVSHPHEYIQHMLKGSPLSPEMQGSHNNSFHPRTLPPGHAIPPPLSPLIFSDVYFDDSSSMSAQTDTTISPTDAPTSAATVYTAEDLQTPTGDDTRKRSHFFSESLVDASAQKKRTKTVPDLRSDGYFEMAVCSPHEFIGVGGDNRCLLRHETFTERAPTPRMSVGASMNDNLPELSSFRPTAADPQGRPSQWFPLQKASRASASPADPASPAMPDSPAWMRPMHLVDTGGKSIYTNVHDDGPIRHALCLWCFRTQGSFRGVHKHGYESCGRREVLDSHYWEDGKWPEDSSDESNDSDH